ncbi:hypothetical protein JI664_05345 [Rhodobacter sp. NTK016B]|uniref:hypothetical protein n=1 Tax=Rhodobacter sp. NTK016B TaxID=2759676 RepID=UPI001A8C2D73|nr:hypothetical protein [Rhodobacter sp. NTK016B]MBN8291378.1 hypothetical protein [Rhodobacter sp. NTK016B]
MPASFRILPARGLAYVRYWDFVSIDDTVRLIRDYLAHPDRSPGQKQLIDLSDVSGFEADIVRLMELQAQKAEIFRPANGSQTLLVYYAPHDEGFEMAKLIMRSWQGVTSVVSTIQRRESHALDILGLPERGMEALLSGAQ